MSWELRLGDCRDPVNGLPSLRDGEVTHVITDPPYSERTHAGIGSGNQRRDGCAPTELRYDHLTPADVAELGPQLARVPQKWCLVMTSHDLFLPWETALRRYTFAPVPLVINGMTVRLQGDGPSSWCVWMVVNRAIGMLDGTKPGAYVGNRTIDMPACEIKGTKPIWLMEQIIRDYTQPGDLICDPFAGSGTTGYVAIRLGRRFLGWEKDPAHHAIASKRLASAREQMNIFSRPIKTQIKLFGGDHGKEESEERQASDVSDHHPGAESDTGQAPGAREAAGEADDGGRSQVDRQPEDTEQEGRAEEGAAEPRGEAAGD